MATVTGTNTEKIDALIQIVQGMQAAQAARNDALDAKIDALQRQTEAKIDALQRQTDAKIDALQRMMEAKFAEAKTELDAHTVQLQSVKEHMSAVRTAALIAQWAAVILVPIGLTVLGFLYNTTHDHTSRLDRIEANAVSAKSTQDELKWQRDRIIRLEALQEKK